MGLIYSIFIYEKIDPLKFKFMKNPRIQPKTNSLTKEEHSAMMEYLGETGGTPLWRYIDHLFETKDSASVKTAMKLMEENMEYFTNLYQV